MSSGALSVIAALLSAVVLGAGGVVAIVAGGSSDAEAVPVLAAAAVPIPSLIPVLEEAGSLCSGLSAPLLAAQIDAESDWNPSAVSPAGAEGIAQFLPGTFSVYGKDDDGTGDASPFDAVDAVMAMGRYDCALLAEVSGLSGDDAVSLMLAAYNAGIGAVLTAHGIPPYAETQAYVSDVESLVPTYTASLVSSSATSFGQAVVAAASAQLGAPYSWGGGNAAGPSIGIGTGAKTVGFDCSGLVLYAVAQASGGGIELPHSSQLQATLGTPLAPADHQPVDKLASDLVSRKVEAPSNSG